MSKAALSEFLQVSAQHLGLDPYHGDTSSHPYVCSSLTDIHTQSAQQIIVAKASAPVAETKVVPFVSSTPVVARLSTGAMITMRYQAIRDKALKNSQGPSAP